MEKFVCPCGYVYDPELGDPDSGIAPGTPWEEVPEDWVCPICGLGKDAFEAEYRGAGVKTTQRARARSRKFRQQKKMGSCVDGSSPSFLLPWVLGLLDVDGVPFRRVRLPRRTVPFAL